MPPPRRVSLIGQKLTELPEWVIRAADEIVEMELTDNQLTEVAFVRDMPRLTSLVLDRNAISAHVVFPYAPTLRLLWLNSNRIENLTYFVDRLAVSLPNLTWLSLMMNPGTPGLSSGERYQQYNGPVGPTLASTSFEIHDYRCYLASRFPQLKMLDDAPISKTERSEGARLYGAGSAANSTINLISPADSFVTT